MVYFGAFEIYSYHAVYNVTKNLKKNNYLKLLLFWLTMFTSRDNGAAGLLPELNTGIFAHSLIYFFYIFKIIFITRAMKISTTNTACRKQQNIKNIECKAPQQSVTN